jgi:hypothetical protein
MSRLAVMKKRGFSESQYRAFARSVGFKIDYSKKLRLMAKHLGSTINDISQAVEIDLINVGPSACRMIVAYNELIGVEDLSTDGILAEEISTTTHKSFCNNGDRNYLTKHIEKNYISEDGLSIDVQLDIMNETYGGQITPDDFISFIVSYPDGRDAYLSEYQLKKQQISSDFNQLVGFNLSDRFAISFKKEHISSSKFNEKNDPF